MASDTPTDGTPDDLVHGEESLIQTFLAPLAAGDPGAFGLADDCAAITPTPGHDLVLKTDPVAEGVHFFATDPPADIGWKALAVNVSDLAAKAATPRAYLMALSFPTPPTRAWLAAFSTGLAEAQRAFGLHLVGGDTDRRPGPVTISITVLGEVPSGTMLRRGTARPGDLLFVSGCVGDGYLGCLALTPGTRPDTWPLDATERAALIAHFRRPQPRLALAPALRAHASAAMDISDGLPKDAARLVRASGAGARLRLPDVPLSAAGRRMLAAFPDWHHRLVAGGDDYEILAAVPPARAADFTAAAAAAGVPVTAVGRVGPAAEGFALLDGDGRPVTLAYAGWEHL